MTNYFEDLTVSDREGLEYVLKDVEIEVGILKAQLLTNTAEYDAISLELKRRIERFDEIEEQIMFIEREC